MINNNSPALQASSQILSFGDADMHEGAMFSFERDLFGYLCLENIGDFLPSGSENGAGKKSDDLRKFGASLAYP